MFILNLEKKVGVFLYFLTDFIRNILFFTIKLLFVWTLFVFIAFDLFQMDVLTHMYAKVYTLEIIQNLEEVK